MTVLRRQGSVPTICQGDLVMVALETINNPDSGRAQCEPGLRDETVFEEVHPEALPVGPHMRVVGLRHDIEEYLNRGPCEPPEDHTPRAPGNTRPDTDRLESGDHRKRREGGLRSDAVNLSPGHVFPKEAARHPRPAQHRAPSSGACSPSGFNQESNRRVAADSPVGYSRRKDGEEQRDVRKPSDPVHAEPPLPSPRNAANGFSCLNHEGRDDSERVLARGRKSEIE